MNYPKQLQIVNDNGNGRDTKIIDPETGQDLTVGLRVTQIVITPDDMLKATLTVMPRLDLRVNADYTAVLTYDPTSPDSIEKAIDHLQSSLNRLRAQ